MLRKFFNRTNFMKKLMTFSLAALLAAAIWFTGCENDISGGDTTAAGLFAGRSVLGTTEQVGAPPANWTQITDSTFTGTFKGSIWAANYGATGQEDPSPASVFVAGGDGGAAAYSPDGVKWTAIPNVTNSETINGIANDGNGTFIMVANNGTLAYTNNIIGGSWTTLTSSATQMSDTIYAVAYGAGSGRFFITGYNGETSYSTNGGATWTAIKDVYNIFSPDSNARAISSFQVGRADTFVAVGGRSGYPMHNEAAYSLSSGSSNTWVSNSNGIFCRGLTNGTLGGVNYFVASGYDMNGTSSNNIAYIDSSALASSSWTPVSVSATGVSGWFDCVTYGGDGAGNGYFVAGGVGGQISYTDDITDLTTSSWIVVRVPGFTSYVDSLAYGDIELPGGTGRFVAVGDNGAGAYTTDPVFVPKAKADAN